MTPAALGSATGTDANSTPSAIAGRIEAPLGELQRAVTAWVSELAGRGKAGLVCYRQDVNRAIRENQWTRFEDITYSAVTSYLGGKIERREWKGTTYNRNLVSLRSFAGFLKRAGHVARDPLEETLRHVDDGGQGARASTLEEARKMIRRAWIRQEGDRRCSGNRALYWLCLFSHACRIDDPSRWKRKHLVLDHQYPHVWWTKDINKNRRDQEVALGPELVEQLRIHLAAIDAERAAAGLPPGGPDDLVFPVVPSPGSFRKDRKAVGIKAEDHRGRHYSAHSARKYFSTTMTALGVPEKMVDYLMRHAGKAEARYYDPPLKEQAAAAALIPRLWPDPGDPGDDRGHDVDNPSPEGEEDPDDLTNRGRSSDDGSAATCEPTRPTRRHGPALAHGHVAAHRVLSEGLVHAVESLRAARAHEQHREVESGPVMSPALPIGPLRGGLQTPANHGASEESLNGRCRGAHRHLGHRSSCRPDDTTATDDDNRPGKQAQLPPRIQSALDAWLLQRVISRKSSMPCSATWPSACATFTLRT